MSVQDVELSAPGGGEEPGNLVWQGPRVIFILYLLGFLFVYIYIYCTVVLLSVCSPRHIVILVPFNYIPLPYST